MFSGPFEVYFKYFFFIVIKKLTNKKPSMRTSYLGVLVAIPVTYFRLTVKVGGFEKEKKPNNGRVQFTNTADQGNAANDVLSWLCWGLNFSIQDCLLKPFADIIKFEDWTLWIPPRARVY